MAHLKMLSTNNVFTKHIHLIYIYEQDLALNYQQGLICHKNPTNQPTKLLSILFWKKGGSFFFSFFEISNFDHYFEDLKIMSFHYFYCLIAY